MASITLFAQPPAMATTQLARVIRYETHSNWGFGNSAERNRVSVSWVVVTDGNGNRKLQMQWKRSDDLR